MKFFLVAVVSTFILSSVCPYCLFAAGGGTKMVQVNYDAITQKQWNSLNSKKIFFGHHSVGSNIINGILTLEKKSSDLKINFQRTIDPASIDDIGIFAHGSVGQNFDPLSKIKEFKSVMDNGMGNKVDIAFMKFCFVDIGTQTDLDGLFAEYKKTLNQLEKAYPHTIFVHVTVPLYVEPEGIKQTVKNFVKKVLSKNNPYENTSKAAVNQLIRAEYAGKEPLFDLAYFESTYPDGRRLTYESDGVTHEALIPEYSSDGGHLNKKGQKVLAEALLTFLANLDTLDLK